MQVSSKTIQKIEVAGAILCGLLVLLVTYESIGIAFRGTERSTLVRSIATISFIGLPTIYSMVLAGLSKKWAGPGGIFEVAEESE